MYHLEKVCALQPQMLAALHAALIHQPDPRVMRKASQQVKEDFPAGKYEWAAIKQGNGPEGAWVPFQPLARAACSWGRACSKCREYASTCAM